MKKYTLLILSLVFTVGVNLYFRSFPAHFPQLRREAKAIVGQKAFQRIAQGIESKSGNLSLPAKASLADKQFSEYKKKNKKEMNRLAEEEYCRLKDRFQDAGGQTYLMELDCWHWGRYVENILRLGHPGDRVVEGKQYDDLMFAPSGMELIWTHFLFYLSAFLYKVFSLFKPVPLFTFLFYLPLFFSAVFIINLYLFCYYRWGVICAVTSSLFVGLAPIFLPRSCAGWFDGDILNLFFPLLVIWSYISAYDTGSRIKRAAFILLSAIFIGLFSFTWPNWWFIFLIILIYELYSLANLISLERFSVRIEDIDSFRRHIAYFVLFSVLSALMVFIFSGFRPLAGLYWQIKSSLVLNKSLTDSIWPNVYSTVGELRRATLAQIAGGAGGTFLFILSSVCLLALFLFQRKSTGFKRELIIILVLWFLVMYFACFKGIRFTVFLLLPLGIALGWGGDEVWRHFKRRKNKVMVWVTVASAITLNILFISNAGKSAVSIFPFMNDGFYSVLVNIREFTPKEAIVNSWWDFGDWFKVVAGRRVIFDGQSQNIPQAHWMARVLVTSDEKEAMGILRMLNNGGNKAFELMDSQLKDPYRSVALLKKIILLEPEDARKELLRFMPDLQAQEIINLLFSRPGPAYFVVEYTMIDKIKVFSYLGNWDFSKVFLSKNIGKLSKEDATNYMSGLGQDNKTSHDLYMQASVLTREESNDWVSRLLGFYSPLISGAKKEGTVFFDNGFVYAPADRRFSIFSCQEGRFKTPKSLFLLKDGKLNEFAYPENDLGFSVLLINKRDDYRALLIDTDLAASLFVRLYFLDGAGLRHFKPFTEEDDGIGKIKVFEIIWD